MDSPPFRAARPSDAAALLDLEREASMAALSHVFVGVPYPSDDVLERWRRTLADPGVFVQVADDADEGLAALVAWDSDHVRHLAVRPGRWRRGLGAAALALAAADMTAPRLWVLAGNARARAFYDHLGWRPTGATRPAEWPPHPTEVELLPDG